MSYVAFRQRNIIFGGIRLYGYDHEILGYILCDILDFNSCRDVFAECYTFASFAEVVEVLEEGVPVLGTFEKNKIVFLPEPLPFYFNVGIKPVSIPVKYKISK